MMPSSIIDSLGVCIVLMSCGESPRSILNLCGSFGGCGLSGPSVGSTDIEDCSLMLVLDLDLSAGRGGAGGGNGG